MKKIIFFPFLLLSHLLTAQADFYNYSNAGFSCMIVTPDNRLIACGRTYGGDHAELWGLEPNGDEAWHTTLPVSPSTYLSHISRTNDGNYIVSGDASVGMGFSKPLLIKFTPTGQMLWSMMLHPPTHFKLGSTFQLPDGSYLMVGVSGSYDSYVGTYNHSAFKMDSTLTNTLAYNEYPIEGDTFFTNAHLPVQAVLSADKKFVVSTTVDNASGSIIDSDSYVYKWSAEGEQIWKTQINNGQYDDVEACTILSDSTIVITGIYNESTWPNYHELFLSKLNWDGDIIWQRFIDSTGLGDPPKGVEVTELDGGDLLITAIRYNTPFNILLIITDSVGTEKHRLFLERPDHEDFVSSTVLMAENRVAIGGSQDQFWDHKNLLVLFPLSIISGTRDISVDPPGFQVFPNPFHSSVSLDLDAQKFPDAAALRLSIFNSDGVRLYNGSFIQNPDLKNYPPGVYYLMLTDKTCAKSFVRRVIKQ
ncbi:MAG TPA: T9SS type A sorting domain-containing protein [Saprospiraceae bacterium]|nr:T9SS type A sorting domain-containing protein [Saprospiraceae bacterium]